MKEVRRTWRENQKKTLSILKYGCGQSGYFLYVPFWV